MEIVRQRKKRLLAWILTLVLCVGMWQGNVMAEGEDGGDGAITPTEAGPTEGGDESAEPVAASETGDGVMPVANGDLTVNIVDADGEDVGYMFAAFSVGEVASKPLEGDMRTFLFTGLTKFEEPYYVLMNNDRPYQHNFFGWYVNNKLLPEETETSGITSATAMFGASIYVDWGGYASGMPYGQIDIQDEEETVTTPYAPISEGEGEKYNFFVGWMADGLDGGPYANGAAVDIPYDQFEKYIYFNTLYSNYIENAGTYALITERTFKLASGTWTIAGDDYTYSGNYEFVVPADGNYEFKGTKLEE